MDKAAIDDLRSALEEHGKTRVLEDRVSIREAVFAAMPELLDIAEFGIPFSPSSTRAEKLEAKLALAERCAYADEDKNMKQALRVATAEAKLAEVRKGAEEIRDDYFENRGIPGTPREGCAFAAGRVLDILNKGEAKPTPRKPEGTTET